MHSRGNSALTLAVAGLAWHGGPQDATRSAVLQLDDRQMMDVARACNRYPNIELNYELADDAPTAGEGTTLTVSLEREDDSADIGPVIAPFYPQKKDEGWWLVLGETQSNTLLAIKVRGRAGVGMDVRIWAGVQIWAGARVWAWVRFWAGGCECGRKARGWAHGARGLCA